MRNGVRREVVLHHPFDFRQVQAARGQIQEMTRHGRPGYDALVDIYRVSPRAAVIDGALADSPAQQAQFARRLARARR